MLTGSMLRKRTMGSIAGLTLALVVTAGLASAQPGGGGQGGGMSDEQRAATWTLEAQGVAKDLGLDEANTQKLVDAYKASRTSQRAATQSIERGPEGMAKTREANAAERAKLKTAVGAFLKAEEADKAVATLGTYSRFWDRYVSVIADLKLEPEKQQQALSAIAANVAASDAEMQKAGQGGDFSNMRTVMTAQREKLDADLGKILSEEQMKTWQEKSRMGGRGGQGGGGGRGEGPRGGGAAPAPPAAPAAK